jgi:hypothetical protein
MATDKSDRWVRADGSAQRLLDEIGAGEIDYYSAKEETAVAAALRRWPLLAVVSRALAGLRSVPEPPRENDAQLRVVNPPPEEK